MTFTQIKIMNKLLLTLLLALLGNIVFAQFTDQQIEDFIKKGNKEELLEKSTLTLLENNFYHSNLLASKLLELEPDNANFNYRKGYSLLMSNSDFTLSKPFLEKAVVKISKNYDIFSSKETGSPVDAYYHLGKSYHLNNDLEKAKSFYNKYLSDAPKKTELGNRAKLNLMQLENATIMIGQPKNYTVENVGSVINSSDPDYSPVVSLDGSALYFTSRRLWADSSNIDIKEPGTNMYLEDIYVSYKDNDGNWTTPQIMEFCLPEKNEATVAVSTDERRIYVYKDDTGNGDIYYSDFQASQFNELKYLKTKDVNTDYWEPHITVTPDGLQKYFSSDRPGGYGGRDLYRIVKLPNGEWSAPQNLGPEINTPYDEDAPFLAIDNKTMYFASNGPQSMGGFDIFLTVRSDDGHWSPPVNLGYPLNTTADDIYYTTTVDGLTGYLTSFRPGGFGEKDIYEIKNDYLGLNNIAVLKGEIETVDRLPLPEDVAFTLRCLDYGDSYDRVVFPRIKDGTFFSSLEPCRTYELIFHHNNGETEFYREKITTSCELAYDEIYRHILLDVEKMQVVQPQEEISSFEPLAMKHNFGYNRNKLNPKQGALKEFLEAIAEQEAKGRTEFNLSITSSASQVTTRTFGTNEKLAQTRAEQLKKLLEDYFASTENLKGKVKISITEVVVAGPEYTNRDYRDVNKYLPFQYVGARIDGINSMGGQPELLQSKDSELLAGHTEISSQTTTSSVDKNGNEFSTGNMIESDYTFNIVAGVFSRIHYAEAYVENLKKKGFDAKIIGKRNGLHVVSAGSSNSLSEARTLLEKVRTEVAQTAWILNSNKN